MGYLSAVTDLQPFSEPLVPVISVILCLEFTLHEVQPQRRKIADRGAIALAAIVVLRRQLAHCTFVAYFLAVAVCAWHNLNFSFQHINFWAQNKQDDQV